MGKFKKGIDFIFADEEDLTLEHRVFLSSIVIGILTSLVGSSLNLVLNTSLTAAVIQLLLSVLLFILYYFVRFRRVFDPLVFPIIILSIVCISFIWVFNGGINGSNIMPGFVILVLGLITVSNKKRNMY